MLRHHVCTQEELEKYYTGVGQEFMLDMLDNEGHHSLRKAYKILKKWMAEPEIKKALAQPPCVPLAERYIAEKRLFSDDRVFFALLYKKGKYLKAALGNSMRRRRFR